LLGLGRVALDGLRPSDCPDNAPISGIAQGIATALRLYKQEKTQGTSTPSDERRVGCLFLVQPNEGNAFDQYHLEFELWEKHEVPVVRATLEEVQAAQFDDETRLLHYQGIEVGLVYFRAGMYVCVYVCMYDTCVCMYVYTYVHTCYVLFKFCFTREGAQGSPLVNPLNNVFFKFMMQITS
jgi:hypothetical protein